MKFLPCFLLAALTLIHASSLMADSWKNPTARVIASPNAEYIVRIDPSPDAFRGPGRAKATIFKHEKSSGNYVLHLSFPLENRWAPYMAMLSDDAVLITFDDWSELGITENAMVLYTKEGTVRKKWSLASIVGKDNVAKLRQSSSSIYWHGDLEWVGNSVFIRGYFDRHMPQFQPRDLAFDTNSLEFKPLGK